MVSHLVSTKAGIGGRASKMLVPLAAAAAVAAAVARALERSKLGWLNLSAVHRFPACIVKIFLANIRSTNEGSFRQKELPKSDQGIRAHTTDTSALLLSTEVLNPKARWLRFLFSSKKGFQKSSK